MKIVSYSAADTLAFGKKLGKTLCGGEVIELVGDVGAGKTTLTKGIAEGLGIADDVQSPSFTISRVYEARDGLQLQHYDFYRLADPGIMSMELQEATNDPLAVVIIEWADVVEGVLPRDRLRITIAATSDQGRELQLEGAIPAEFSE